MNNVKGMMEKSMKLIVPFGECEEEVVGLVGEHGVECPTCGQMLRLYPMGLHNEVELYCSHCEVFFGRLS
jgi:hypothetical protein